MPQVKLVQGDSRVELAKVSDSYFDSVVSDPPYEIGLMKAEWDSTGISFDPTFWSLVHKSLKPGGHLVAFADRKKQHLVTTAIEQVGFELRDVVFWFHGGTVPKSKSQLRPFYEPILIFRKPFKGPLYKNVDRYGTGEINIEECRNDSGRWPTNIILSHLPECIQSGTELIKGACWRDTDHPKDTTKNRLYSSGVGVRTKKHYIDENGQEEVLLWQCLPECSVAQLEAQWKGASRFLYVFKAPNSERNSGGIENTHKTVKPVTLMKQLIKLVTPNNGLVCDPFTGSGSTGVAAVELGFDFYGIELSQEYITIAQARINNAL